MILVWWNPFWKRQHLGGPWTVHTRGKYGLWWHYVPTWPPAWKLIKVLLGWDEYKEDTITR